MLFMVSWKIDSANRNAAIERFLATGGQPPKGMKMLGRWHSVGSGAGVAIGEADDPTLAMQWALQWTDLMTIEVVPVVTDEQGAPLLAAAIGKG